MVFSVNKSIQYAQLHRRPKYRCGKSLASRFCGSLLHIILKTVLNSTTHCSPAFFNLPPSRVILSVSRTRRAMRSIGICEGEGIYVSPEILLGCRLAPLRGSTSLRSAQDDTGGFYRIFILIKFTVGGRPMVAPTE